jgi:preprotein translocase subunit YajC
MKKKIVFIVILLLADSGVTLAFTECGTVTAVTNDTITVRCERQTVTCKASQELLTNVTPDSGALASSDKFIEVKKGDKVRFEFYKDGADATCVCIHLQRPHDAGTVTEVGKDAITIRNDKGKTTTYRLTKELVDGTLPGDRPGSNLYPSRFSDVTKGCKIEVFCWEEGGVTVIGGLDVKKEKEKDK